MARCFRIISYNSFALLFTGRKFAANFIAVFMFTALFCVVHYFYSMDLSNLSIRVGFIFALR